MFKFLAANNEAILTYWPLNNVFHIIYLWFCYFYTLTLFRLNIFNELNEPFEWQVFKNELKTFKSPFVFYFLQKSRYNCQYTNVFLILLSCYSINIIPPWQNILFEISMECSQYISIILTDISLECFLFISLL